MHHRGLDQRATLLRGTARVGAVALLCLLANLFVNPAAHSASEFRQPWLNPERALVLDGFEHNEFNLPEIVKDKRIAAFIHKGSDGMPADYHCKRIHEATDRELCKKTWRNYSVSRELYQTRRALAKALGLKWGAYHLARPGNPVEQANHFLDYAEPTEDELMAIDIEDNNPDKWMSLSDAEIFVEHIRFRTGRYPVLYTNGNTAKHIADNRLSLPVLSRLPLWYARYKPDIGLHFPKGNWTSYTLWQFVSQDNCSRRKCAYRPNGTNLDIDVNVADMTVAQLRREWPFDTLVDAVPPDGLPLPSDRPAIGSDALIASAEGLPGIDQTVTASISPAASAAPTLRLAASDTLVLTGRVSALELLRQPLGKSVEDPLLDISRKTVTTCIDGPEIRTDRPEQLRFAAIGPFLRH